MAISPAWPKQSLGADVVGGIGSESLTGKSTSGRSATIVPEEVRTPKRPLAALQLTTTPTVPFSSGLAFTPLMHTREPIASVVGM